MNDIVLVTGASGGIGSAIAHAFAQAGYRVALGCCRHEHSARQLQEQLLQQGAQALVVRTDVTSPEAVEAMFAEIEAAWGPVGTLVNNAGIAQQKLFTDITPQEWHQMMDVHATAAFLCCRRALPAMVRSHAGCIVNIASMWGQVGASCEVHYSAAKAALIGLTKALAQEVAPSGIRVNCVAPGAVDTAMMAGFSPEEVAAFCGEIPMQRLAKPDEIAQTTLFLASDAASYVTGQVLGVNGGYVM